MARIPCSPLTYNWFSLEYTSETESQRTTEAHTGVYAFLGDTRLCLASQGSDPAMQTCGIEAIVDPVSRKRGVNFVYGQSSLIIGSPLPPEGVRPCSSKACGGCFEVATRRHVDQDYLIAVRETGDCHGWKASMLLLFKRAA